MNKNIRIAFMVISLIVLFPFILGVEVCYLIHCIRFAKLNNETIFDGFIYWLEDIKRGVELYKDIVINETY